MNGNERTNEGEQGAADALEENVERLLRTASAPPRMSDEARARVLGELLLRQARSRADAVKPPLPAVVKQNVARLTRGRAAAIAGVLALAAGAALWLRSPEISDTSVTYDNPGPAPREFTLRDGSRVVLDSGAVLVERAPRDVRLVKGQVIFDVATQAAQFLVETSQGRAAALGTRFWMRMADDGAEVAVAKGRVEIASTLGDRAVVRAGEEGILHGAERPKASAAPRVSHFFDFARKTDVEAPAGAPRRKGTLTARDPRWGGKEQPLELRSFDIDVRVEDGFAQTTIDQTYFNPKSRQLEGTYAFPLPQGAAISRLAMYVDGQRMEGAMVERSRGRDIYEGIVEQRRDPALLEWMSGNTFRMRVFPLPARTDKRIFMSYTQPLEHLYGSDRLVVPIPAVDQAAGHARFTVRVVGGASKAISSPSHTISARDDRGDRLVSFEADNYVLGQDLVLTMNDASTGEDSVRSFAEAGDRGDRFVMIRHAPDVRALAAEAGEAHDRAGAAEQSRRIAILFDVSASRSGDDLAAQARFVDGLLDSFDDEDQVSVITVGYDAEVMPGGPTPASKLDREKVGRFLLAHGEGLGDSRFAIGLGAAMRELDGDASVREVIYVGDGVEVTGAGAPGAGGGRARSLANILDGKAHFIGVGMGDSIDRGLLDAVADATGGLAVTVGEDEDLQHRAFDLVASTYTPCIRELEAEVLDDTGKAMRDAVAVTASRRACDGERIEVVARASKLGASPARVRVHGRLGAEVWEKEIPLAGASDGAAFLPRVFAERRVSTLLADEPPGPGRAESPNAGEITDLAKRYFLVTPFTSLLVLENDAMYKQYAVAKKKPEGWAVYDAPEKIDVHVEPLSISALASAPTWDVLDRLPKPLFQTYPQRNQTDLGLIGTIGFGGGPMPSGGFGSSRGRLGGAHRYKPPTVRMGGDSRFDARLSTAQLIADPELKRRPTTVVASASASPASVPVAAFDLGVKGTGAGGGGLGARHSGQKFAELSKSQDTWVDEAYTGASLGMYAWSSDPNLVDLTSFAPSMFTLEVDRIGDYLEATRRAVPFEARARTILERYETATAPASFTGLGDATVSIARGGIVDLWRVSQTKLREHASLRASKLSFEYEELGLGTKRDIGPAVAWWLADELPWIAPSVESLDGLDVTSTDDHTLVIRAPQPPGESADVEVPDIELSFDDSGRVVRVRLGRGDGDVTQIAYRGDAIIVKRSGEPEVTFTKSTAATPPSAGDVVEIEMPLSNPRRWTEIIERDPHGRDAAYAQRQLLATYAAVEDVAKLSEHLLALQTLRGTLSRGEVVLASRALAARAELREVPAALAKGDPVREYLSVSMQPTHQWTASLTAIGAKHPSTLLGLLASYRSLLGDTEDENRKRSVLAKVRRLHAEYPDATFFRYAAVRLGAERLRWSDDKLALSLWDTLSGDPALGFIADRQAVDILRSQSGKGKEAADRAIHAFETALERGIGFQLDWQLRYAVTGGRGQVGLDVLIARWRTAVLQRGNARQVVGLVSTLLDPYGGQQQQFADIGAVLKRLDNAPDSDDETRLTLARMLLSSGRIPEAKQVLSPVVTDDHPDLRAIELAGAIAEQEGDLDRAAALLDRLLRSTEDQALDLEVVRSWYARLVNLHMRRAGLAGSKSSVAIQQAVAVAGRWRREDPDNATIDELCASALFRIGNDVEARRHLYSIVERRPAEGGSWARVATLLEQQGDLEAALESWGQAAKVEPTNPTWLLSNAQGLLARDRPGDRASARTMLDTIAKGKWQDRFSNVTYSAKNLLESM